MVSLRFLLATAAIALSAPSANAAIAVPSGLNAGDNYHVIFVSSTTRDGLSSDILDYDAHVTAAADAAGIGSSIGLEWRALGSTTSVDAIDHISPLFSDPANTPIYNQNGDLVATSLNALFSGGALSGPILYDETGLALDTLAWTGTFRFGEAYTDFTLGSANKFSIYGNSNLYTSSVWLTNASSDATQSFSLYGVSGLLTVVPVPAAAWLFGSSLGVLAWVRRRAKS
jgi:hypothetical protein